MTSGFFISFEGIDGAGKSSHLDAVASYFVERGRSVLKTREPGGTPLAEKIRAMVLQDDMDPVAEALMMFAARRDHVEKSILPALERGDVVVCDRFSDSSFAYQGFGRGVPLDMLERLESWVQGALQPDLTFWFDLEPAIAAARLSTVRSMDRFEREQRTFFERVRRGYAHRSSGAASRFVRIEADGELSAISSRIETVLRAFEAEC